MPRRCIVLSACLAFGCGPAVGVPSDEGSGSSSSTSSTSSDGLSTSSTSGASATVGGADSTTLPDPLTTSTTSGPSTTGGACDDAPTVPPATPAGCPPIPLVDEDGNTIEGSHSGLVTCPERGAPDENVYSIFRTGRVPCPTTRGSCACDSDCGRGETCLCDMPGDYFYGNECVAADCSGDADCGGQRCRAPVIECGTYDTPYAFHCTSPEDDCSAHTTCIENDGQLSYCNYDGVVEMFTCSPGALCE